MTMKKLAIFDMDGTILDTLSGLASSANYALTELGFPTHTVDEYRFFVGNGLKKLLKRMLPPDSQTDEIELVAADLFNEDYEKNSLASTRHFDGIPETLAILKSNGIKLAVATNKPPQFARMYATHFFGSGFFDCVVGPGENIPPKPDPEMVFRILDLCRASENETCYFGDSNVDIWTGKAADVVTAGVAWGFRPEAELWNAGADMVLYEPKEILQVAGVGY